MDDVNHALINTHEFHMNQGNIFQFIASVTCIFSVGCIISREVFFLTRGAEIMPGIIRE